jgi:hypothetical protein
MAAATLDVRNARRLERCRVKHPGSLLMALVLTLGALWLVRPATKAGALVLALMCFAASYGVVALVARRNPERSE